LIGHGQTYQISLIPHLIRQSPKIIITTGCVLHPLSSTVLAWWSHVGRGLVSSLFTYHSWIHLYSHRASVQTTGSDAV